MLLLRCYTPESDDCKRNAAIYSSLGGPAVDLEETSAVEDLLDTADIIIDAVFGTGFHGSLEGSIAKLFGFCQWT